MGIPLGQQHIRLEWYELEQAGIIGLQRQIEAFRKNLTPKLGYWSWHSHIEGALAELAVAKALNIYWAGGVNTFGAADVGADIQVRLRKPKTPEELPALIVRPNDKPTDIYILVTGESPQFTVVGWISGLQAQNPEFLADYGGRGAAYFVPQHYLRSLHEL